RDRQAEARQADSDRRSAAESMADSFLARQAEELSSRASAREAAAALSRDAPQQKIKLSLGAAVQRRANETATQHPARKSAAEVEGLLEDEEDDDTRGKRVL